METDGYIEGTLGLVISEQDRAEGKTGYTKEEWESLTLDQLEPTLYCEHEDGTVDPQTGRKRDNLPVGTIKKTWVGKDGQMCIRADFYTTGLGQQMRQNVLSGNFNKLSIGYDAYNLGTKDKPYYKSNFRHVGICRIGADPSAIIQVRASMSSGEGAKQQLEESTPMDTGSSSAQTPAPTPPAASSKKDDAQMSDDSMFEKFKTMTREELAKKAAEQEAQRELLEELKAEKLARDQKRQEKLKVREQEAREAAVKEAKALAAHLGWSEELTMQNAPLFASKDEHAKRIAENFRQNAASIQKLKEEAAQARKEAEDAAVVRGARQGYDDARKRGRYTTGGRGQETDQDKKMAEDISNLVRGGQSANKNSNDVWAKIFSEALGGQTSPPASSSSSTAAPQQDSGSKKIDVPSWLDYMVRTQEPAFNDEKLRRDWAPAVEVRQSAAGYMPFIQIRQSSFGADHINKYPEIVSLMFSNPDDVDSEARKEDAWNTWVNKSRYDLAFATKGVSSSSSSMMMM